jgi:hypothetical protein
LLDCTPNTVATSSARLHDDENATNHLSFC